MPQRPLDLPDLEAVVAEIERLHAGGYAKGGTWDLSQICAHCTLPLNDCIDGFQAKVPWIFVLFGRLIGAKRHVLRNRKMRAGLPAPRGMVFPPGADEAKAVADYARAAARFEAWTGPLHKHPFLGVLTRDEWYQLHVIHTMHHLSFLYPK